MRCLIIETSGRTRLADVGINDLDWFQQTVGGYIEPIELGDCTMFCNEDGRQLDLPVNPTATRFAKQRLAKIGRILLAQDGWLLGTCVITGPADGNGDGTDVPESALVEFQSVEWSN